MSLKFPFIPITALLLSINLNLFSSNTSTLTALQPPQKNEQINNYDSNKYVNWLLKQSMLYQASTILSPEISGKGIQWRHEYFLPQPVKLVKKAPVWLDIYPISMIGKKGQSTLQLMSEKTLWQALQQIGIRAIHTNPMQTSGGIVGNDYTPTVDGGYDPIMYKISPQFGTDSEYKTMVKTAAEHNAIIVGSIIPGHTGLGADFRLAELNFKDFPGIYSMIEIDKKDWHLLPEVKEQWASVYLDKETVEQLHKKGYLPGRLQNVRFKPKGMEDKVTGWDVTAPIKGVDGKTRRWVYLHYYRAGQATMNWMDPSFAAQRIIAGAIINNFIELGNKVVRLDANAYLGIEPKTNSEITWSDGTPLSIEASNYIAMFARKMGGWTFQEVGQPLPIMKEAMKLGPDMSIDFITRTGLIHAVFTGDTRFLNLKLRQMQNAGISPSSLIHCLQTHDNFGYDVLNKEDEINKKFQYGNTVLTGNEISSQLLDDMNKARPYIRGSKTNMCTTYCGLLASRFGIEDLTKITDKEKEKIKKGLLLASMYCAMQPGIIMITGWDLVGALPLSVDDKSIAEYLKQGDYRWLNRGSYDLIDSNKDASKSPSGITKAVPLFGPINEQLKDSNSFVSKLKHILQVREKYKIHLSELIAVPETGKQSVIVMINELPENKGIELTVSNFGDNTEEISVNLNSFENLKNIELKNNSLINILDNKIDSNLNNGKANITLEPLSGKILLIR